MSVLNLRVGVNDLASQYPDVAAEWHPTKNGEVTPRDITRSSRKKMWWQCSRNPLHEWEARISARTQMGNGCPFCSGRRAQVGVNDLASQYPDVAAEWHPTKNGNLTARDLKKGSNKKVWWQCARNSDHEWEASVANRTQMGSGCPFCSGRRAQVGVTDLASQYPDVAAEFHPTKNGDLTAQQLTRASHKTVWWQCSRNPLHEWESRVAARTQMGNGCPFCSGRRAQVGVNDLASQHPDIAAEWHPTKNGDLTAQQLTRASHKTVWWQCSRKPHHEWESKVANRVRGSRCPFCTGRKLYVG
jgi:uncharacterized protein YcsI (UPF0317 family)